MHTSLIALILTLILLAGCTPAVGVKVASPTVMTPTEEQTPTPGVTRAATQGAQITPAGGTLSPRVVTPTVAAPQLCSPLAEHTLDQLAEIVSSPYAPPPAGKDDRHHGVDFAYYNHGGRASVEGEGVQSILAGRVVAVVQDRLPYGNLVIIATPLEQIPENRRANLQLGAGEALYHLYAHLEAAPEVTLGQTVACGELLGYAGMTGYNIPVPHLHLETRTGPANTSFEAGLVFYDTHATPAEQENYLRWRTSGEFQHFDPLLLLLETP